MSVVEIVICTVFGIAFIAFIGGAAACLWIGVIQEWRDEMSENRWGVVLEMFMNESVPRVSPVCPKCHKTYYAWPDVEDYCTRCGAKLDGRDSLLSDYWNGRVGNYERDKKVMKERYGVDI